jgi:hypothetical protein
MGDQFGTIERHVVPVGEGRMRSRLKAAFGLGILALTASCERGEQGGRELREQPSDVILGAIKSDVEERRDGSVSVHLTWTLTGANPRDPPYAPVVLSNGRAAMDARSRWTATPDGNIDHSATVVVPAELWREGCWQAQYVLPGTVFSGPADCMN